MLLGRVAECDRLDGCLTSGRAGHSAAVLLRGEAGIGKTALLDYVAERAEGWRVTRSSGVESEMELPFAGVHQLCATMLGDLDRLPAPQADALATAFGLKTGPPPDRFLIGLAVLTLLSNTAEQRPLLCLVDDVQWLDLSSVQVLAFVARRLQAESVVIVFAEREPRVPDELARLPELRLAGLSQADAATLLRATIAGPLDEQVRDRLLLETRGVPLALLELPGDSGPADLAGGYGLPSSSTLSQRIEETYRRRIRLLPKETQLLALAAAAEPTGEATLLWRAAALLDVTPEALGPAQDVGLMTVGAQVAFRHPLMRTAAYAAAPGQEQRRVHQALAMATDAAVDPDRRAWHLAHATVDTNDEVADELEQSASRAQARGGLAAAAAFLERAVALTSSQPHRARRALEGARAKQLAGAPGSRTATAGHGGCRPIRSAAQRDPDAPAWLDRAGPASRQRRRSAPARCGQAPRTARPEPVPSQLYGRDQGGEHGGTARRRHRSPPPAPPAKRPPPTGPPRGVDLLLDGLALRFTDGYVASADTLKRALAVITEEGDGPADTQPDDERWPWLARRIAPDLFDDDTWYAVTLAQRADSPKHRSPRACCPWP